VASSCGTITRHSCNVSNKHRYGNTRICHLLGGEGVHGAVTLVTVEATYMETWK
jgi:hypothetical protein